MGPRARCLLVLCTLSLLLLAAPAASEEGSGALGRRSKAKGRVFGNRIPRKYIVVTGFGETDQGMGTDPYETGAHDLAMEDAGIHEFNLVEYTSILPPESEEISLHEARKRYFHHGAVLECIMSEVHGSRGDRITAGVGRMMVHMKEGNGKGRRVGGFAAEYKGHAMPEMAEKELESSLQDIFDRRYDDKAHEMSPKIFNTSSKVVSKSFGTAMAGICFVDFIFPELGCEEMGAGWEGIGEE